MHDARTDARLQLVHRDASYHDDSSSPPFVSLRASHNFAYWNFDRQLSTALRLEYELFCCMMGYGTEAEFSYAVL
jgi:hypothetical protein